MKYAIAIALLGVTSVSAAPYYVGENLQPKNNVTLGFGDTMTKKDVAAARNDTGNIATLELKGAYSPAEKSALRLNLPFYMSSKNASLTGTSRNALGNFAIGGIWSDALSSSSAATSYGYSLSTDVFLPTSRKIEGESVARANPTTDLYKYTSKATAFTPTVGVYAQHDAFSAKTNIGLVYAYFPKSAPARHTDANHFNLAWQTAGSWHIIPNLHGNLEYNTIYLDTASSSTGTGKKFAHALTPSLSGNYEKAVASAFATIPLDSTTRKVTNVAFGLNAGYTF
ncbi:MAG: hypothetical protein JWQ35_2090 [Bacteriovoracaceae bacterium]|nr:hypothetical protein [Bacteriovoracaceae bacterium]